MIVCIIFWHNSRTVSENVNTPDNAIRIKQANGKKSGTSRQTSNGSLVNGAMMNSRNRGTESNREHLYNFSNPVKHIAFLKVHKVASGTMQNLFLRFGIEHDLVFVLPKSGISLPMQPGKSISSVAIPPPAHRTYDVLCSHVRYNRSDFQKTLPSDSVYIATVRDPFRQFISSIHYYHRKFMLKISKQKPILKFLQEPNKYTRIIPENGRVSNFFNSMAWDFGFPLDLFVLPDKAQIQEYISQLDKDFDLVIIVEYFDESLVLMRRLLNWDMRNILYISSHVQKRHEPAFAVGEEEENLYRKWCLLDYALFDFFKSKFLRHWESILTNSDVLEELRYFRDMKSKVDKYCREHKAESSFYIKPCKWHAGFLVDKQYCNDRLFTEIQQVRKLQRKQTLAIRRGT
ncbi:galactosylceramide sulfotransferase-like [Ylistrum balloti]|uniref:galactosylceramide sulfotransferase-like n=1 Tax=Ylistrum balloti TaxID=509963 RepID=UPI002905D59E|nr:galactosylceramide sulfotransferase-like [Ylistrum balloti]